MKKATAVRGFRGLTDFALRLMLVACEARVRYEPTASLGGSERRRRRADRLRFMGARIRQRAPRCNRLRHARVAFCARGVSRRDVAVRYTALTRSASLVNESA